MTSLCEPARRHNTRSWTRSMNAGLEGGHELDLVDQAVLKGQQAEEKITIGDDGFHGVGLPEGRRLRCAFVIRGRAPAATAHRIGWILS